VTILIFYELCKSSHVVKEGGGGESIAFIRIFYKGSRYSTFNAFA
jgi:hypothetical protein